MNRQTIARLNFDLRKSSGRKDETASLLVDLEFDSYLGVLESLMADTRSVLYLQPVPAQTDQELAWIYDLVVLGPAQVEHRHLCLLMDVHNAMQGYRASQRDQSAKDRLTADLGLAKTDFVGEGEDPGTRVQEFVDSYSLHVAAYETRYKIKVDLIILYQVDGLDGDQYRIALDEGVSCTGTDTSTGSEDDHPQTQVRPGGEDPVVPSAEDGPDDSGDIEVHVPAGLEPAKKGPNPPLPPSTIPKHLVREYWGKLVLLGLRGKESIVMIDGIKTPVRFGDTTQVEFVANMPHYIGRPLKFRIVSVGVDIPTVDLCAPVKPVRRRGRRRDR